VVGEKDSYISVLKSDFMNGDDEYFKVIKWFVIILVVSFLVLIVTIFLNFLFSPQTGNVAGYPITMPGIAWIGVPVFLIIVLIVYAKYRM